MNMPDKINIQGRNFSIEKLGGLFRDSGRSNSGDQIIWINSGYPEEYQASTLLHEIIEMINDINELGLEHQQIMTLEVGLYQVLKENRLHFDEAGDGG